MKERGLAIVTGASRGIGAAIAAGLAGDGYRTVLIARGREGLERVRQGILEQDAACPEPILLPGDITDYAAVAGELSRVCESSGPVEVLVNSAAIFLEGSLEQPVEQFRRIMDVNVTAQYNILQTVAAIMKKQRNGWIINIASRAGKYGFSGGGTYSTTKFALVGLTESLYRELAPLGIRVTALCPGWVDTDMAWESGTPLKAQEMIQPEDMAKTVLYLLNLSPAVRIREIVLEVSKSII